METVYVDKNISLVQECRLGSRKAQFELYKLYAKAMYNVALRILNHVAEAEDVIQESFLEAFNRVVDFRGETTFGLWLKQIVVHKSINCLRKRKVEFVSTDQVDVAEEEVYDSTDDLMRVEEVKRAMEKLPDGYRVVISLYLLEGYDHEEIGHILKISENTSRTQYSRAKIKLRSLLEKERRS